MKYSATIGYIPLTDSAPLVIAKELGFFRDYGVDVELQSQHSWATLRDKLHAGVLDAAQMLAPMPFASQLGLGGQQANVITPMVLSLNGNAITLSTALYEEIQRANDISEIRLPLAAYLLEEVVQQRQKSGTAKLKLATVYPYSCHFYQLHHWLKSGGLSVEQFELVVVPPISMVDALHCGDIDGYCVGGPWNAKAVRAEFGVTVLTSFDVWRDSPEKVLGVLSDYYAKHPKVVHAICCALKKACEWLESVPNRFEAARILSRMEYLDAPIDVIAPSLIGSCLVGKQQPPRQVPGYNQFSSNLSDINLPSASCSEWLLQQMIQTGQVQPGAVANLPHNAVFRSDIYRQAMQGYKE